MKLSQVAAIIVLGAANTLAACGGDRSPRAANSASTLADEKQLQPTSEANLPTGQEQPAGSDTSQRGFKEVPKDDLKAFLPTGATLLSSAVGDLNRDGRIDAAIVADPARTGNEFAGEGPSRIVMLLIRDRNGQLHKAQQNVTLIPCEKCGGMGGDPFGYIQVSDGTFTAVIEGGSPSVHWSEFYEFDYQSSSHDWILRKAEHGVSDRIDGRNEQKNWTIADLGEVRFEHFDRSKLPHPITLLEQQTEEP